MGRSKRHRCRQCGCIIRDSAWVPVRWCELCVRTGAPSLRHLWYQQLDEAVAEMLSGRSVEVLAHRPTTAQPGSLDRMLVYAARVACNVPIFHPRDEVPTGLDFPKERAAS